MGLRVVNQFVCVLPVRGVAVVGERKHGVRDRRRRLMAGLGEQRRDHNGREHQRDGCRYETPSKGHAAPTFRSSPAHAGTSISLPVSYPGG